MSCKFSDFQGYCTLFEDGIERPGCDSDGACICNNDTYPSDTCDYYKEVR